ncbi:MAG: hypothetical protein EZS28_040684 [Streblomastix strix]|uniref:Uncharacterized protein n=1 Tax=Streblomastix strix TaxID=222440 RepID=A0A5J4U0K9_9EUKA|nr:MAG: hypothetical protein EZS28_040684 [Streblomastix strix]
MRRRTEKRNSAIISLEFLRHVKRSGHMVSVLKQYRFTVIQAQKYVMEFHMITICRTHLLLLQFDKYFDLLAEQVRREMQRLVDSVGGSVDVAIRRYKNNVKVMTVDEYVINGAGNSAQTGLGSFRARLNQNQSGSLVKLKSAAFESSSLKRNQNKSKLKLSSFQNGFVSSSNIQQDDIYYKDRDKIQGGHSFIQWVAVQILMINTQRSNYLNINMSGKESGIENANSSIQDQNSYQAFSSSTTHLSQISKSISPSLLQLSSQQQSAQQQETYQVPKRILPFPEHLRITIIRQLLGQHRRRHANEVVENEYLERGLGGDDDDEQIDKRMKSLFSDEEMNAIIERIIRILLHQSYPPKPYSFPLIGLLTPELKHINSPLLNYVN